MSTSAFRRRKQTQVVPTEVLPYVATILGSPLALVGIWAVIRLGQKLGIQVTAEELGFLNSPFGAAIGSMGTMGLDDILPAYGARDKIVQPALESMKTAKTDVDREKTWAISPEGFDKFAAESTALLRRVFARITSPATGRLARCGVPESTETISRKGRWMNTDGKLQVAQRFLKGVSSRDWNLIRPLLTEDIVWTLPGESRISGEIQGIDAAIARLQQITGAGVQVELLHVLFGLHHVALSIHNTANVKGKTLDEHLATVCTLREGKISRIETFVSDVDGVNRFFS